MSNILRLCLCLLGCLPPALLLAQPISLSPTQDNTLYESGTGALSNGAGAYIFAGNTNQGLIRRALLAFDIAGNVPAGATITSASLTLHMNLTIAGTTSMGLHVVQAAWGEGSSTAGGNQGAGGAAQAGDATWIHRFFSTDLWATPGGDFGAAASAITPVDGNGAYTWSSPQMVADVQNWLDNPATNFGWMLRGDESTQPTAKRFASREFGTASERPTLVIDFTLPCSEPEVPTLTALPLSVCPGAAVTLTATGNLNDATAWHLYTASCGGTPVSAAATGSFTLNPITTTTYFVRGEGGCATPGNCASVTVTVLPTEDPAFSFPAPQAYCQGGSSVLPTLTGLPGGSFSSSPAGLSLDASTGEIALATSQAGTYTVQYLTPGAGCPDSAQQLVTIWPSFDLTAAAGICDGDTFVFGSQVLTSAGTYTETFSSQDGCDSTMTLFFTVDSLFSRSEERTICEGDSVIFGTQVLFESGQYSALLPSTTSCDTFASLLLTVQPPVATEDSVTICAGTVYAFGTQSLSEAGVYTEVFATVIGCDSTVTLTLGVTALDTAVTRLSADSLQAAAGLFYQWLDCDTGAPIAGATERTYTAQAGGPAAVAVIVSDSLCADTSACFGVSSTSRLDRAWMAHLQVMPNPTAGITTVDLGAVQQEVRLSLYNLQGQRLRRVTHAATRRATVDLAGLPAGWYLLQVEANGQLARVRLLKE